MSAAFYAALRLGPVPRVQEPASASSETFLIDPEQMNCATDWARPCDIAHSLTGAPQPAQGWRYASVCSKPRFSMSGSTEGSRPRKAR